MNELLERAKAGDVEAFNELIKSVKKDLAKVVSYKLTDQSYIEDVLQNVFFQAYIKLPTLQDNERFRAWIFKIAENKCKNLNRDLARHREINLSDFDDNIEDIYSYSLESNISFEDMISDLTEEEKYLLRMKFQQNFSNTEISKLLGIPYNTVKSKIRRALQKITLIVLILIMLSGFTAIATFVIKQIRAHFTTSLNAINTAVENDYVQEIDSDFVYDNGIGIKVDAIVLDDKNLDISFVYDVQDKDKYGEITGIGINEYVIKDENNKVIFDFNANYEILLEAFRQYPENVEKIDNNYRNSILFSVNKNLFPEIDKIIIEVSSVYVKQNDKNIIINGKWKIENDIIDILNERDNIEYIVEENKYIKSANVSLKETSLDFDIILDKDVKLGDIEDALLYNNDKVEFNCINGIFFTEIKKLKMSFDLGLYTENMNILILEIPTEDNNIIKIKFRRGG